MSSASFPKSKRLTTRQDFLRLQKKKKTFVAYNIVPYIAIDWSWNYYTTVVRLGITVTTRQGSSVERNLFKRRVRESFRQSLLSQKTVGLDIQVRPKGVYSKGEAPKIHQCTFSSIDIAFCEFEKYISSLLKKEKSN